MANCAVGSYTVHAPSTGHRDPRALEENPGAARGTPRPSVPVPCRCPEPARARHARGKVIRATPLVPLAAPAVAMAEQAESAAGEHLAAFRPRSGSRRTSRKGDRACDFVVTTTIPTAYKYRNGKAVRTPTRKGSRIPTSEAAALRTAHGGVRLGCGAGKAPSRARHRSESCERGRNDHWRRQQPKGCRGPDSWSQAKPATKPGIEIMTDQCHKVAGGRARSDRD